MSSASHRCSFLVSVLLTGFAASIASADVFNLGGVRNPQTGEWTGVASLEMAPVGNPGNAPDPATGYGQVNYNYNIGRYDVTAGQYAAFLNAVAASADPKGLFNSNMSPGPYNPYPCGITRSGPPGSYTYTATLNPNFPVTWVTFWDACRFTNWLQNGQPTHVQEDVGTTETGAYDLTNAANVTNNAITRSTGATFVVASENEWYKAAYYDPIKNGVGSAGYWRYPTRNDSTPSNVLSATGTNNTNYFDLYHNGNGGETASTGLTPVGAFAASPSAYGTFDQGGNVWQWNDTIIYDSSRELRGASFDMSGVFNEQASARSYATPISEGRDIGFRVVQLVPEPTSLTLLTLTAATLLTRRHRRH